MSLYHDKSSLKTFLFSMLLNSIVLLSLSFLSEKFSSMQYLHSSYTPYDLFFFFLSFFAYWQGECYFTFHSSFIQQILIQCLKNTFLKGCNEFYKTIFENYWQIIGIQEKPINRNVMQNI